MRPWINLLAWLACIIYSTIPAFWLIIHPFAARWRARHTSTSRSPYRLLVPAWFALWMLAALATNPRRHLQFYSTPWAWLPAALLFAAGFFLYAKSSASFTARQLGGFPEVHAGHREQRLVTDGIRARVRHPVYLAHLCEMLAWSLATGLAVCFALTAFAILTGALMIRTEDAELEQRFGDPYRIYRRSVPAVLPRMFVGRQYNPNC